MLELHLTTLPMRADRSESFADLCGSFGGKALVIELARGTHDIQPMATFHVPGGMEQVRAVAGEYSTAFDQVGFAMVRCKIEFDLDAVRRSVLDAQYVEWHGRVDVAAGKLDGLRALCERSGAHLSRNAMRRTQQRFITVRAADEPMLRALVGSLRTRLTAAGWALEREHWEGVAFDSNLELDQGWL